MLGSKTVARALVFGAGYVLGAKAGRERYEEIRRWTEETTLRLREQYAQAKDDQDQGRTATEAGDRTANGSAGHRVELRDHAELADIRLGHPN